MADEKYGYNLQALIDLMAIVQKYTSYDSRESFTESICNKIMDTQQIIDATDEIWIGESYEAFKTLLNKTAEKFSKKCQSDGVICIKKLSTMYTELRNQIQSIVPEE